MSQMMAWSNSHPIEFTVLLIPVVVTFCAIVMHFIRKMS